MKAQEYEGIPKFMKIAFAIMGILVIVLAAGSVLASFTGKADATTTNTANSVESQTSSKLSLNVNIPCSGHASLIIYDVKKLSGVSDVKFIGSNKFDVYYDPAKTSEQKILAMGIFKEYPAKKV